MSEEKLHPSHPSHFYPGRPYTLKLDQILADEIIVDRKLEAMNFFLKNQETF